MGKRYEFREHALLTFASEICPQAGGFEAVQGLIASGRDSPMTRQWNFITAACSIKTIWIPGTCSLYIRVRDMPSTMSERDSPLTRQWNP